jgi:transcriptional regulator with XRE-family HTH domain
MKITVITFNTHQLSFSSSSAGMSPPPNSIDTFIGARIRSRRKMLFMTVERLADMIGASVAELVKFEAGAVRIGAEMLSRITQALDVTPLYLFPPDTAQLDAAFGGSLSAEIIALNRSFASISDPSARRTIIDLATMLAAAEQSQIENSDNDLIG